MNVPPSSTEAAPRGARPARPAYDVVIVGGGLAGLTLALQLKRARSETSVLVAERRARPAPEATFKVGESTSEIGAHYFREVVGLRDHLHTEQIRKYGLRFFFPAGDNASIARRVEAGAPPTSEAFTYQIDRGRFENELWDRCLGAGVEAVRGWSASDIALGRRGAGHDVVLRSDDETATVAARWLVDASGRAGLLRRKLELQEDTGHHINAAWFRLAGGLDVEEWSDDAEWLQRLPEPGLRKRSTVHLTGEGYWVWLIQLASGPVSIGVCADPRFHPFERISDFERLLAWLEAHEPQLAAVVAGRREQVLDFLTVEDFSYGCKRFFSADRWCLTGEAGAFLDPLYSPGSDFIALANSAITDLVVRDLGGERISPSAAWSRVRVRFLGALLRKGAARTKPPPTWFDLASATGRLARDARAECFEVLYAVFFGAYLSVYRNQYHLFGNPQVFLAKWGFDTLGYWAVIANLVMHGKWTDLDFLASLVPQLDTFRRLFVHMAGFFSEWHALDGQEWQQVTVSTTDFPALPARQLELDTAFDDDALRARVEHGVEQLLAMAVVFFHKAAEHLPEKPREDVPINAFAVSLQPDRWKADGLVSADGITLAAARELLPGVEQWFLDRRGAVPGATPA